MAARKLVRDLLIARQPLIRQLLLSHRASVGAANFRLSGPNAFVSRRQFGVLNDISNKIKGELDRNKELKKSVDELKEDWKQKAERLKGVKEDLEARTKQSTEQLYKIVDGVREEAGSTAKKVISDVEEKISAAKTEVKDSFGFSKQESSGSTGASEKSGAESTFAEGKTQEQHQQSGPGDQAESFFGKIKLGASMAFQKVKEAKPIGIVKKGYDIVKDELTGKTSKRRHLNSSNPNAKSSVKVEKSSRTDIVVVPKSKLEQKLDDIMDKLRGSSIYRKAKGLSEPAEEIAENVRDWYETSDSPVVHKIQNLSDTVFGETDVATSTKEIKIRDPNFSLPEFVADVEDWVRPVLNAYFKADAETLNIYCTPELIERCKAEHRAFQSQDLFIEHKILHISEVDVREVKLMGDTPIIIVGFRTQEVHCVRDRHGEIREGGKDTIKTVFYHWALQQIPVEELGEDALHPVWRLREMQQFGVQALI
ncbi:OLC1v1007037C1 [Oldenlandia corymbosa var. corymbosa]|uniref:OLC1v1007037C1 n=1 Tax=Oldenlandia corymbosa var. corymbosa TaxID=529605 RepID=A0AAV1DIE7_OLDCO|nr:OLC1v1007037C1 [Oldenlandia corymbosa var. corymbosa]